MLQTPGKLLFLIHAGELMRVRVLTELESLIPPRHRVCVSVFHILPLDEAKYSQPGFTKPN